MNKSVILAAAMLGGVLVLLAMLLHGGKPVEAASLEALALDSTTRGAAREAPFLAHLATLNESQEKWAVLEALKSGAGRISGAREALSIPWLDVPMDWSIPQRDWRSKLRRLADVRLIDGLRDDRVGWNATASARILCDRLKDRQFAAVTRWALETAFAAPDIDKQAQRLCAGLLQVHSMSGQDYDAHEVSDALVEYTVDSLDNWSSWDGEYWIASSPSGHQVQQFLLAHLDRGAARIAQALLVRGPEQSFAHAFLLGKGGYSEYAHLSAPILVDHLRDNYYREDALMSIEALRALGDHASPWLWGTLRRSDLQQEYCIRLLLEEAGALEMNPESAAAQKEPLTWKFENPVRSWRFLDHSSR